MHLSMHVEGVCDVLLGRTRSTSQKVQVDLGQVQGSSHISNLNTLFSQQSQSSFHKVNKNKPPCFPLLLESKTALVMSAGVKRNLSYEERITLNS